MIVSMQPIEVKKLTISREYMAWHAKEIALLIHILSYLISDIIRLLTSLCPQI